jgi:hypothetical protein
MFFGWGVIFAWVGVIELFIGLILVIEELVFTRRWNKRVALIKTHDRITLQEAAAKINADSDKTRSIIYEALSLGYLSGKFDGATFTQSKMDYN